MVKVELRVIIDVKMTHQQMTSYAVVTREPMSRALRTLEKAGVIQVLANRWILLIKDASKAKEKKQRS